MESTLSYAGDISPSLSFNYSVTREITVSVRSIRENERRGKKKGVSDKDEIHVSPYQDWSLLAANLVASRLSICSRQGSYCNDPFSSPLPLNNQCPVRHIKHFVGANTDQGWSYWDRMHWHMRLSWAWAMTSIFTASNTPSWVQSSILDTCWWSSLRPGCWLTCRLASMSAFCWFCGELATAWWRHVQASLAQLSSASFWVCWKLEYCLPVLWLRPGGIGARSSLSALLYGTAPFQEWVRPGRRYEQGETARSRRLPTDTWRHTSICNWSYPHGTASVEGMKERKPWNQTPSIIGEFRWYIWSYKVR